MLGSLGKFSQSQVQISQIPPCRQNLGSDPIPFQSVADARDLLLGRVNVVRGLFRQRQPKWGVADARDLL